MKSLWTIRSTRILDKQASKLSQNILLILRLLFEDLARRGPTLPDWPNYGKLYGKKNEDKRHCHLQNGKPTYVCCWEVLDKQRKIIEVYYVGTHEKAPISTHAHGSTLHITHHNKTYVVPKKVIEQYAIETKRLKRKKKAVQSIESLFERLDEKFTKAGALLKGLRLREGLSQIEFAKKIKVTQANLSNMESGKRPIGKSIAKRIEKTFAMNYRYFLE